MVKKITWKRYAMHALYFNISTVCKSKFITLNEILKLVHPRNCMASSATLCRKCVKSGCMKEERSGFEDYLHEFRSGNESQENRKALL
jgi:hypothetical protein